jgi:hypothetical protein
MLRALNIGKKNTFKKYAATEGTYQLELNFVCNGNLSSVPNQLKKGTKFFSNLAVFLGQNHFGQTRYNPGDDQIVKLVEFEYEVIYTTSPNATLLESRFGFKRPYMKYKLLSVNLIQFREYASINSNNLTDLQQRRVTLDVVRGGRYDFDILWANGRFQNFGMKLQGPEEVAPWVKRS